MAEGREGWGLAEGDELVPGRYVLERLGGGHRYEAYLAWDEELYSLVVVKVLRPERVDDPRALDAIAAEASILEGINHPVIVRGFGLALDGPRPHLVLEHMEGPRLSTLLRKYAALSPEQWLPLALQICSALHYLSIKHVVHLDVKPSNIIMGAPPRLIDFSIARTLDEALRLTESVGTDAYMSPEQCDPSAYAVGSPADVWGLGITLYEALEGRRPFDAKDEALEGAYPQLLEEPKPFEKNVPDPLSKVIFACLAKEPHQRPTAAEVHGELEPFMSSLPRRPVLGRLKPKLR